MAAQPTDEDIKVMCDLTKIGRSEAISRLKGNNNDVTQAMNEFFDNPGRNPYVWDEGQFNSDRDGSNNKPGISFQVQGPDDHGAGDYLSGAPSRPPSRTSNKSPLGRAMASEDHAHPLNANEPIGLHDVDLQKALAESAQEAGLPPQEYGVVYFGPANRESHEYNQWQMIHLPNASAREVLLDPEAADRKREDGTPAFLKPSSDGSRLASILTIYHEIPLAREVFLRREDLLSDYGHDSEWWKGKAIGRKREIWRLSGGNIRACREGQELFHELQRLMAFLDKTERSYGSVEALASLSIVKNAEPTDIEGKFFEAWKCVQEDNPDLRSIFSHAIQPNDASAVEEKDFVILDLVLPNADDFGDQETLYDLTDRELWPLSLSDLELGSSAYLTHVAGIIGFRLTGTDSSRSARIPETWFPDRYLEEGKDAALQMRKQKAEVMESMMKIFNLENKLKYFTLPDGRTVKVQDLFDVSFMHDAEPTMDDATNGIDPHTIDTEMGSEPRVGDKMDVSAELQKVMASINRKLQALDEEKQKALTVLHELSKLYTEPDNDPKQPPFHKYKLCGVSTNNEVTYIRRQVEPDLIDIDLDATEAGITGDQWWKIKYTTAEVKPVTIVKFTEEAGLAQKVTLQDVLTAAMTESKATIVIYASERAMSEPVRPLPDSLEAFVRADNLAFSAEFPENHELQDSHSQVTTPVSPGKRKYDDSSEESTPPRYSEQPKWGGMSPHRDNGVIISHRELDGPDDSASGGHGFAAKQYESGSESITPRGKEIHDVIMGQDPNELAGITFPSLIRSESQSTGKEMQEKRGLPSFLSSSMEQSMKNPSHTDSMDVDEMTVDEADAEIQQAAFIETEVESK